MRSSVGAPKPQRDESGVKAARGPAAAKTSIEALAERFAPESPTQEKDEAPSSELTKIPSSELTNIQTNVSETRKAAPGRPATAALVTLALTPIAILLLLLWQGMIGYPHQSETPAPAPALAEIALSTPDKIEAKAGEEIGFAIAVDSTESLPARSLIAVSGLPDGALFSQGRPYGMTGWSLRPDEIGDLRLELPHARSGAFDMRIELLAADGTVLAQSETRFMIDSTPEPESGVSTVESNQFGEVAQLAEATVPPEALPALPERRPADTANGEPAMKVASVKVVTIKPAPPTRQSHDGAFALSETVEAEAEWVEIVSAVDMHARAQQSSETVNVLEKGVKVRVTGRDKNWVQVMDPATSKQGWIYKRFLKPAQGGPVASR